MADILSAVDHVAVTKSDVTTYDPVLQGVYVGTTGDVSIKPHQYASAVVYKAVPAGTFMPICAYQVMSTGTTAADLVGLKGDY